MELQDLAPWIAIAITLGLSILVPFFTQIANNSHQLKLQNMQFLREKQHERIKVFENFLSDVGGVVNADGIINKEDLVKAGAALHRLYAYAPEEWFDDLELLSNFLLQNNWAKALPIMLKFDRLISLELNDKKVT